MVSKLVTIEICFTNIDDLNWELFLEYRGTRTTVDSLWKRVPVLYPVTFGKFRLQFRLQCSLFIYCKMLVYAYSSYLKRSRRGMLVKYVNYV